MKPALAVAFALAVIRIWMGFVVEPEHFSWLQLYKDAAHLFMGGLAVAWCFEKKKWQWRTFWGLSILEVAVAVLSRIL